MRLLKRQPRPCSHFFKAVRSSLLSPSRRVAHHMPRDSGDVSGGDVQTGLPTKHSVSRVCAALESIKSGLSPIPANRLCLKRRIGKPFDFSFEEIYPVRHGVYLRESYDSFSQLLDEFYSERDRIDRHAPTLVRSSEASEQRNFANKPQTQQSARRACRLRR